ncbi:MAG TPA: hypothetical protein PLN03_10465 [Spirochaetota bacterium]|nr:hypothetical protein [Spirochaetota bacterium]HOK93228.1 hypothetical protein [Spirochaetota bacterium]
MVKLRFIFLEKKKHFFYYNSMNSKFVINYLFLLLLFISCLSQGKVTEDGRIQYINRRYYFSIDLPSSWSNYSVFEYDEIVESDIKVKAIYFALPTRSRDWAGSVLPEGFAPLFYIRIFNVKSWELFERRNSSNRLELNYYNKKIGSYGDKVYMVKYINSLPVDLYLYARDIPQIISSFKAGD